MIDPGPTALRVASLLIPSESISWNVIPVIVGACIEPLEVVTLPDVGVVALLHFHFAVIGDDGAGIPWSPLAPSTPEVPEVPEIPDVPSIPASPLIPWIPWGPMAPFLPLAPLAPIKPFKPDVPEVPDVPLAVGVPVTGAPFKTNCPFTILSGCPPIYKVFPLK